jgi:hypothetical protein
MLDVATAIGSGAQAATIEWPSSSGGVEGRDDRGEKHGAPAATEHGRTRHRPVLATTTSSADEPVWPDAWRNQQSQPRPMGGEQRIEPHDKRRDDAKWPRSKEQDASSDPQQGGDRNGPDETSS